MPSFVNDLSCRNNLINLVYQNEVEHNMCLTLGEIGSILYVSNIIHALNSFTVQFMGPSNIKVLVMDSTPHQPPDVGIKELLHMSPTLGA
jgi:hypothetical protein